MMTLGTAATLVMHYENLPKSAGTAYRRVTARKHAVISADWRLR